MKGSLLSTIDEEPAVDFIRVLVEQENNGYYDTSKLDWLTISNKEDKCIHDPKRTEKDNVDVYCRTLMVRWFYNVVSISKMQKDTVEIAASYLDRFMTCLKQDSNRRVVSRLEFQLISMTCLYLAIKIHERLVFDLNSMVRLCGKLNIRPIHLEQMEIIVLRTLHWRLCPPTTSAYIYSFMDALMSPCGDDTLILDKEDKDILVRTALIQTDYCYVSDTNLFFTTKPSIIAYCAFMNALESFFSTKIEEAKQISRIGSRLADVLRIKDISNLSISSLQDQLYIRAQTCGHVSQYMHQTKEENHYIRQLPQHSSSTEKENKSNVENPKQNRKEQRIDANLMNVSPSRVSEHHHITC